MTDPANLPYRPCAGIMLLNRDGKVFVGPVEEAVRIRTDETGDKAV